VSPRGFTLLEVMVALVMLGLVVVASLEVFGGALRTSRNADAWAAAVAYATEGMELAKLDPRAARARGREVLPGDFAREVYVQSWVGDLQLVTVTVVLPEGGEFRLNRLLAP